MNRYDSSDTSSVSYDDEIPVKPPKQLPRHNRSKRHAVRHVRRPNTSKYLKRSTRRGKKPYKTDSSDVIDEQNYYLSKEFRNLDRRQRKFTKNDYNIHERSYSDEEREERLQEMSDMLEDMKDFISDYRKKKDTEISKNDASVSQITRKNLKKYPKPGSNPQVTFKPEQFLIKSGFLYKKGLKWHHWKKRFFRIFLDDPHTLRYYSSPRKAEMDAKLPKRIRKGTKISLLFASVYTNQSKLGQLIPKKLHKNKNIVSSYQIYIQTKQIKKIRGAKGKQVSKKFILTRLYYLSCVTEIEFNNWTKTLKYIENQTNECIKEHENQIKKGQELRKAYIRQKKGITKGKSKETKDGEEAEKSDKPLDMTKYDRAQSIKGYGSGVKQCIAGEKSKFLLEDFYQSIKLDKKKRKAKLRKDLLTVVIESNELHYDLDPVKMDGSKYLVEYMLTRKGEYELSILYDGIDIYGSPFKLYCIPAKLCASKSFLLGDKYVLSVPRKTVEKTVELNFRNVFDERVLIVNEIDIDIETSTGIEVLNKEDVARAITEKNADKVVIKYVLKSERENQEREWISVKIDDKIETPSFKKDVKNSPFFIQVIEQNIQQPQYEQTEFALRDAAPVVEEDERQRQQPQAQPSLNQSGYFTDALDSSYHIRDDKQSYFVKETLFASSPTPDTPAAEPLKRTHGSFKAVSPTFRRQHHLDQKLLRLFQQHETVMKSLFQYFGSDFRGIVKLGVAYDIIPTFISQAEIKAVFSKLPADDRGQLEYDWFKICLAQVAIFSLSKPMFAHLYSTDKSKVNVLLNMWGIADPTRITALRQQNER